MPGMAPGEVSIVLSAEEQGGLSRLVCAPSTSQKPARRARIVLLAAGGATNVAIAVR